MKNGACAVDGRARAARRTSRPSRCPESHAYVVIRKATRSGRVDALRAASAGESMVYPRLVNR